MFHSSLRVKFTRRDTNYFLEVPLASHSCLHRFLFVVVRDNLLTSIELFESKLVFTPLNHLTSSSVIFTLGFARSLFKIYRLM